MRRAIHIFVLLMQIARCPLLEFTGSDCMLPIVPTAFHPVFPVIEQREDSFIQPVDPQSQSERTHSSFSTKQIKKE
jgi:hypothetical protein